MFKKALLASILTMTIQQASFGSSNVPSLSYNSEEQKQGQLGTTEYSTISDARVQELEKLIKFHQPTVFRMQSMLRGAKNNLSVLERKMQADQAVLDIATRKLERLKKEQPTAKDDSWGSIPKSALQLKQEHAKTIKDLEEKLNDAQRSFSSSQRTYRTSRGYIETLQNDLSELKMATYDPLIEEYDSIPEAQKARARRTEETRIFEENRPALELRLEEIFNSPTLSQEEADTLSRGFLEQLGIKSARLTIDPNHHFTMQYDGTIVSFSEITFDTNNSSFSAKINESKTLAFISLNNVMSAVKLFGNEEVVIAVSGNLSRIQRTPVAESTITEEENGTPVIREARKEQDEFSKQEEIMAGLFNSLSQEEADPLSQDTFNWLGRTFAELMGGPFTFTISSNHESELSVEGVVLDETTSVGDVKISYRVNQDRTLAMLFIGNNSASVKLNEHETVTIEIPEGGETYTIVRTPQAEAKAAATSASVEDDV